MIALDGEVAEKQIASIDGVAVLRFRGTGWRFSDYGKSCD